MQRHHRDIGVLLVFGFIFAALLVLDESNWAIAQSVAVGTVLVAGSHITRRILFNRLDLQDIAVKATEHPVGAGIVFAAICMFLMSIMWISMAVLK